MVSDTQANLNRVRDNQRRSRARRREYIRSLEERLGLYKREGVEVTSHIQRAAQRVAEQNQKMRVLLNTLGFNDERINCFLQNGNINPMETIPSDFSPPSTPAYTSVGMNITESSGYDQAKLVETLTANVNECFHMHDRAAIDHAATGIASPGYLRYLPSQSHLGQPQGEPTLEYTQGANRLPNGALAHNNHFDTSPGIQHATIYDQAGDVAVPYLNSPHTPAKSDSSTAAGSQVLASALQHCQNQINSVFSGDYITDNDNGAFQTLL
ncbi:hypothetical protein F4811DRAFT_541915 [Daldinia bambusicola]|nr:hypothetical protein F4811DRAFT_541915 [Daldinia bambusicola]